MRLVLISILLVVAGCSSANSEAEQAQKEYNLLKASGATSDELCQAHQKVAQAWLKALDKDKYQFAKVEADLDCNQAALDRLGKG